MGVNPWDIQVDFVEESRLQQRRAIQLTMYFRANVGEAFTEFDQQHLFHCRGLFNVGTSSSTPYCSLWLLLLLLSYPKNQTPSQTFLFEIRTHEFRMLHQCRHHSAPQLPVSRCHTVYNQRGLAAPSDATDVTGSSAITIASQASKYKVCTP